MNRARITMLGSHEESLRYYLETHPKGYERGAIVLFKRLRDSVADLEPSDRYIAVEVVPFQEAWITGSSRAHVAFDLIHFRELFRRCEEESLVFGFAHIHPGGPLQFSDVDEENEVTLATALRNRNGPDAHFVALLLVKGAWIGRVRQGNAPQSVENARHVAVLNRQFEVFLDNPEASNDELFLRQAAAFGAPFVSKLKSLRVAVVGAGGTGSPTISLLARAGVGEIVVIDDDTLEKSNLNRVRGAGLADVGKKKAQISKSFVDGLRLGTRVAAINASVDQSPEAVDALASCDVIFGCTDDQIGRETLNAALYFYAQVCIDVGLGGQVVDDAEGLPFLKYHYGRISTIFPERGECLFCQDVIRDVWIRHQYALRQQPTLDETEAQERYLERGGEQAPGVGPFTSAVADYGVATLFDIIRPFRKFPPEVREDFFKIDFVRMEIRSSQEKNDMNCPYCKGKLFLLAKEPYRLSRPALGKRDAAI